MGPDEAESEGCGGPTVKDDNEVWPHLRRNPKGRGQFFQFLRHSSLEDTPYSSLLAPRTGENWLPAPPVGKFITGSRCQSVNVVRAPGNRNPYHCDRNTEIWFA
jgi:hypothetical protein